MVAESSEGRHDGGSMMIIGMIRRSMEGRVAIVAGRMHDHSACLSAAGNEDYAW